MSLFAEIISHPTSNKERQVQLSEVKVLPCSYFNAKYCLLISISIYLHYAQDNVLQQVITKIQNFLKCNKIQYHKLATTFHFTYK